MTLAVEQTAHFILDHTQSHTHFRRHSMRKAICSSNRIRVGGI